MDIKLMREGSVNTLEYNVIGGVLDFYFLAGSETDPAEVARQYAQVVGTPAEVPYWSFGLHQCRYGYHGMWFGVSGALNPGSLMVLRLCRRRGCHFELLRSEHPTGEHVDRHRYSGLRHLEQRAREC